MAIKISKKDLMKLAKKSPMFSLLIKSLVGGINRLMNDERTEEEISYTMAKLSPDNNGFYNPKDYLTIDKCMVELGFGQNRVGCIKTLKEHKIYNEKFNNVSIGYNRNKVLALREKLKEEVYNRECKQALKDKKRIKS